MKNIETVTGVNSIQITNDDKNGDKIINLSFGQQKQANDEV